MSNKNKSSSKIDSQTSLSFGKFKFDHRAKQALSDVTATQATSHAKLASQNSSYNSRQLFFGGMAAAVLCVALTTAGDIYLANQETAQIASQTNAQMITDLTQCKVDLATALISQKNNQELAVNLGISADGLYNHIKVEIYDNRTSMDSKIKELAVQATSTASYIEQNPSALSTPALPGTFRSIVDSTENQNTSLLEALGVFDPANHDPETLSCKMPDQAEKNSCQPGDNPDDYDDLANAPHPVG